MPGIAVEHKIYFFLYQFKYLVRKEHARSHARFRLSTTWATAGGRSDKQTGRCGMLSKSHKPHTTTTLHLIYAECFKHVLHRYAGERYFHPCTLVYSDLWFCCLHSMMLSSATPVSQKARGTETHYSIFDTVVLFSRSISIQSI